MSIAASVTTQRGWATRAANARNRSVARVNDETEYVLVIEGFSGAGGASLGIHRALPDATVIGIEHDRDACATRAAAGLLTIRADIAQMATDRMIGKVTGAWFSPPCFPAGVVVVTARGIIPIETVEVGDLVLTHKSRWREVMALSQRTADTVKFGPFEATANHPYLSRDQFRTWNNPERRAEWHLGNVGWANASESQGKFVALPINAEALDVPEYAADRGPEFWWMVGRWLGDGWLRLRNPIAGPAKEPIFRFNRSPQICPECGTLTPAWKNNPLMFRAYCTTRCSQVAAARDRPPSVYTALICCGVHESEGLEIALAATGHHWMRFTQRTGVRFAAHSKALVHFLDESFGRGAASKTIPGWVFGLSELPRTALLEGYLSADGHKNAAGGWSYSSASRGLAVGMRLLATTLGMTSTLSVYTRRGGSHRIEGRSVNVRPEWRVALHEDDGRYTRVEGGHRWIKQRKAVVAGQAQVVVYDLTVDEDESFVADGLVVHNCPQFSTAGKGAGTQMLHHLSEGITRILAGDDCRAEIRARILPDMTTIVRAEWDKKAKPYTAAQLEREAQRRTNEACLVLEPARFAHDLRPEWVACEQVPAVLPLWVAMGTGLERLGYGWWAGVLDTADYGVAQNRLRAILMARRGVVQVQPPAPSHCDQRRGGSLFGLPKWISMAERLGWGCTDRPMVTVATGHLDGAGVGGSGARAILENERGGSVH